MEHTLPKKPDASRAKPAHGRAREELVQAAIRVVVADGVGSLSHRTVAEEAGVTHGLVRHYFGSMTALLHEALDSVLNQSLSENPILQIVNQPDISDSEMIAWIDDQIDLQVFQYELLLASRRQPELQPLVVRLYDGYHESAREAFAALGAQPPSDAHIALIVVALDGLVLQAVTNPEVGNGRLEPAMSALRELVLRYTAGT